MRYKYREETACWRRVWVRLGVVILATVFEDGVATGGVTQARVVRERLRGDVCCGMAVNKSGVAACQKLAAVPMLLAGDRSPSLMVGRPQTLG